MLSVVCIRAKQAQAPNIRTNVCESVKCDISPAVCCTQPLVLLISYVYFRLSVT